LNFTKVCISSEGADALLGVAIGLTLLYLLLSLFVTIIAWNLRQLWSCRPLDTFWITGGYKMRNLILSWITVAVLSLTGLGGERASADETDAIIHDHLAISAHSSNSDMDILSQPSSSEPKIYAQSDRERQCVADCNAENSHCLSSCLIEEELLSPGAQACMNRCQNDYLLCANYCR
jgi:hypothetical protein